MRNSEIVEDRRSTDALCISVERIGDGNIWLVFDDAKLEATAPLRWRQYTFITNVAMGEEQLRTMAFSDEDLAEFGRTVLGSLAVHLQRDT